METVLAINGRINAVIGIPVSRTLVMGVLTVTEDSFSDGGIWLRTEDAVRHAHDMAEQGADIIDIGAESTRPGARRVPEDVEEQRVLGVLAALAGSDSGRHMVPVSVDTTRSKVADSALKHGAAIINDVSGGQLDPELPHVAAAYGCPYIVQHWRGWLDPGAAGGSEIYGNGVVNDVYAELMHQVDAVRAAGVSDERIIIDPGLGLSKPEISHNLPLISSLARFQAAGYPVLIGHSRKRFIGSIASGPYPDPARRGQGSTVKGKPVPQQDDVSLDDKDAVTAGLSALIAERGAWAVRVHDVRRNVCAVAAGDILRHYMGK